MSCFHMYIIYIYMQLWSNMCICMIMASNGCVMLQSISGAKGCPAKTWNHMEWCLVNALETNLPCWLNTWTCVKYAVQRWEGSEMESEHWLFMFLMFLLFDAYIWSITISAVVSWCLIDLSHHNFRALRTLDKCCQDWVLESWVNCFFKHQMVDPYCFCMNSWWFTIQRVY